MPRHVAAGVLAAVLLVACAPAAGPPAAGPAVGAPRSEGAQRPGTSPPSVADAEALPALYGTVTERDGDPEAREQVVREHATSTVALAVDLYRELADGEDNLVLGPYSLSTALLMAYAGARGSTATQMSEVLHLGRDGPALYDAVNALDLSLARRDSEGVEFRVANRAWAQEGLDLLDGYLDILTGSFGAPLAPVDFAADPEGARGMINRWGAELTSGGIDELFPEGTITSLTVLVLANGVYLDAEWAFPFDPEQTRPEAFTLADGTKVQVPTMRYDQELPSAGGEGWQAVELPYAGEALSMVVIVPDDLAAFEASLTAEKLATILEAPVPDGIHLTLPRFAARSHVDMIPTLRALGMTDAFDDGRADLSGMIGSGGLFIDAVEHEAFVTVDEAGTEAGAMSGVGVAGSHGPTISVDRPFLFAVRDGGTGALLFLGRVLDPRA